MTRKARGGDALRVAGMLTCVLVLGSALASATGPYRNRDNPNLNDPDEPTYPVPYQRPKVDEITEVLRRIHGHLDRAVVTRVVDRKTGAEVTDFSKPNADAFADPGEKFAYSSVSYPMGVILSGMLLAGETTGDPRFNAFVARQLGFIGERLPYFRAQAEAFGARRNSFHSILSPGSLDDSGSMCAALVKARLAAVGPDLKPAIDTWADFISHKQFRLPDGTLARQRPQRASLWSDDFYMSIPALAQMGRLTGERAYYDDAVKNVMQMSARLFNPHVGLFMHGRNMDQPLNPEFYWGRANGWAMMAIVELLDVLPEDHPGRDGVLAILRAHVKGVAERQSGDGLWHQLLDRTDSYTETSASAMFIFSIARAINRGWISPISYGSLAQAGWAGLVTRINDEGEVEGTCVGTTFASDAVYYYHRPQTSVGTMAYGAPLLAGAEMVRLLKNDSFDIQHTNRTYHYVPKQAR